jgi:hypothetical protein
LKQSFNLKIQPEALEDIQEAIYYYNSQQKELGNRFYNEVEKPLELLKRNPFFQIRYDDVRCLPIKRFPFMIHFFITENNKIVIIYAVINTHKNPAKSWIKKV